MALLTSQRINQLYKKYGRQDITFNKQVISVVRLVSSEIFLKCLGEQWRCVIYSCSMIGAKIVMKVDQNLLATFREAKNAVSLRFCFKDPDKSVPITFFVASKIVGFNPYSKTDPSLQILTLTFNNQPPEDLIAIIGQLVEANVNSKNRSEERIIINAETTKALGLAPKSLSLVVSGIARACILRDLSFTGSKIIISGLGKFLVNKKAMLNLKLEDIPPLSLEGTILRYDEVEGRKDLSTLGFKFDEEKIPIEYKMRINEILMKKKKNTQ